MRRDPVELIQRIYEYLERKPHATVSGLSKDIGINRRTAKKYLKLLVWIGTRPYVVETYYHGARHFILSSFTRKNKEYSPMTVLSPMSGIFQFSIDHALGKIQKIASSLNLSHDTFERALDIYSKHVRHLLNQLTHFRWILINDMAAASVYLACQICKTPRTLQEIAETSDIKKEDIESSYRILEENLRRKTQLKLGVFLKKSQM